MITKKRLLRPKIGGAVYILPNLLTTGNLFFGYFSIMKAIQGNFYGAAISILLAAIFDILDGRVARLTNGTSEFGVQYDSLCDLVSFGLAPSILIYLFALKDLGRIGLILCFILTACGALRLARFNVQSALGKTDGDFTGLPIPMPACLLACYIAFVVDIEELRGAPWLIQLLHDGMSATGFKTIFFMISMPYLALMMVSNFVFRSHKKFSFRYVRPFKLLVILVIAVGLMTYRPALTGFLFFFFYACSGPLEWVLGWKKPTDDDEIFPPYLGEEEIDENERVESTTHQEEAP